MNSPKNDNIQKSAYADKKDTLLSVHSRTLQESDEESNEQDSDAEEEDDEPIVKKSAADFANKSFDSPRGMLINNLVCLGTKLCT